jgi:hypothetical protein
MRHLKRSLEAIIVIGITMLVGTAVTWLAYSNYAQCLEDGYTRTVCRNMLLSRTVVVEVDKR